MTAQFDPSVAEWFRRQGAAPTASDSSVAGQRAHSRVVMAQALELSRMPAAAQEVDTTIAGVPVRVLTPADTGDVTIAFFHGGGWIAGDPDSHLQHARRLAHGLRATVVSVDYRLAPEHPFPAAYDDCLAVTRAIATEGDGRVVVAGDSAGGQLAASVALACRDEQIALAGQLLIAPVIDLRGSYADPEVNALYPSRAENAEGYGLALAGMATFVELYGADPSDRRACPMVGDLEGVAPAVVHTAGFDPLRDEGAAYAAALEAAGVPVLHRDWPTLNHSFYGLGGVSPDAAAAAEQAVADLRTILENS